MQSFKVKPGGLGGIAIRALGCGANRSAGSVQTAGRLALSDGGEARLSASLLERGSLLGELPLPVFLERTSRPSSTCTTKTCGRGMVKLYSPMPWRGSTPERRGNGAGNSSFLPPASTWMILIPESAGAIISTSGVFSALSRLNKTAAR